MVAPNPSQRRMSVSINTMKDETQQLKLSSSVPNLVGLKSIVDKVLELEKRDLCSCVSVETSVVDKLLKQDETFNKQISDLSIEIELLKKEIHNIINS